MRPFPHIRRGRIEYGRHAGPWCAFYDLSTYNCGFQNYAQCYATIYGNGGWCRHNFFEPSGRNRRSGKMRPPARYPGLARQADLPEKHFCACRRGARSPRATKATRLVTPSPETSATWSYPIRTFLIHPPSDLPDQRRDELHSGSVEFGPISGSRCYPLLSSSSVHPLARFRNDLTRGEGGAGGIFITITGTS